jgi:uncharacterized protein (TIGR02266 family)
MAQETRKDPRAKVLTVTVRYKSATLDEFIEHHSHDVSRGGMFIKTVSPFPAGTLLKIEVRIAGDQRVMQGVGRVVWKRESGEQHDGAPAGMGVKFIKIDDASRQVIDQLVAKSGGAVSAFDKGGADAPAGGASASSPPAADASPAKPTVRKATMIGLGAMGEAAKDEAKEEPAAAPFFPNEGAPEQPAPEDRTVMKQAAELLQDALREAGGSLDDVGTPGTPAASSHPPPPVYDAPRPGKASAGEHGAASSAPPAAGKPSEKPAEAKKIETSKASEAKPATSRTAATTKSTSPVGKGVSSQRPGSAGTAARRAPVAAQPAQQESGSGRIVVILLALVAVVGGAVLLSRLDEPPPPPAEVVPAEPVATQTATAPVEPTPPPVALSALPPEPGASASAAAPTPAPEPAVLTPTPEPAAPPVEAKKPKAPVAPKPQPKPAAPAAPSEPTAAQPAAPAPSPTPKPTAAPAPTPTEAKPPVEPKPAAEPKAPAEPKPAPAPKPSKSESDNPF